MINISVNIITMISNEFFNKLTTNHPFITICSYANQDYVGIVQNRDEMVTTIYDYGSIIDTAIKEKFLELGEIWWWESNRKIPINIFLKKEMSRPEHLAPPDIVSIITFYLLLLCIYKIR